MTTNPNQGHSPQTLKDVLDAYALECPSFETLPAWIKAYPNFETELRAFTDRWVKVDALPEPKRTSEERSAEARITATARADRMARLERAMPNLDALAAAEAAQESQVDAGTETALAECASLDDLIDGAGLTKSSFRKRLGLGLASWAHFRSGMLSAHTEQSAEVYHRILDEAAAILQKTRDRVLRSLPKAPVLPAGYSRAQARPEAREQVDAVSSLESDPSADPAAVAYYLRREGTPPSQREPANPTQP